MLRYVELFQGRLREFLTEGLSRGVQYLPMIQATFRAEGLPLDLAYIPLIESAFKPSALSRAKARGVWQFMRGTALENGLSADWYLDERADPTKATQAAAKYLKTLYGMFEDWHLAMASYNGGPGRVKRALTRSRKIDFWSAERDHASYLPRETRDYVPMILAAVIIAKNPAQYGFDIVPIAPTLTETVDRAAGAGSAPRRRMGRRADGRHPDAQPRVPPLDHAGQEGRIHDQGAAGHGRQGPRGPGRPRRPGQLNAMQLHTVKRGETLATIAKKLQVNRTDLAEANYLRTTSRVAVGAKLIIPRMPSAALLARASSGELENAAETIVADVLAETTEAAKAPVTPRARGPIRCSAGDTLSAIARKTGTTITQLKNWNKLRTTNLKVGTQLLIQSPRARTRNNEIQITNNKEPVRRRLGSLYSFSILCSSSAATFAAAVRPQGLDALLDALGHLALTLQRAQRVLRFLHHEVEAGDLLADVIDHRALLAEHLEVDVDVVEQVGDRVGARLHLFDHLAPRVRWRRSWCRCR